MTEADDLGGPTAAGGQAACTTIEVSSHDTPVRLELGTSWERGVVNVADAHPALLNLARTFSSVQIMGPPVSDRLLALVSHLYSVEEAEVCRGLTYLYPRSLGTVARLCKRDPAEVLRLLEGMAQRRVVHKTLDRYMLYPLIPGLFEYVFMTGGDSPWHVEYSRLVNDLFGTGYVAEYLTRDIGAIRNISVQEAIAHKNYIVGADLMSNMLDAHERFAVLHHCPCRHSKKLLGRECKRAQPDDGCLVLGEFSTVTVSRGNGRAVSREEMREIVAQRWEKNLVFLTANVDPASQNVICTCCDCCCHALETANHYSRKFVAPPHSVAEMNDSLCNDCGRCVRVCNSYAHVVEDRKHLLRTERCIGCGHCVRACSRHAIQLIENPAFQKPKAGYIQLLLNMLPPILLMGMEIQWKRWFGQRLRPERPAELLPKPSAPR